MLWLHRKFLYTLDRTQSRLYMWQWMKLGYICIIQRQKNHIRSGDKAVNLNQKRFNTGVSLQGGGICFLGQRWDTADWLLQEGCKNRSRLLHISLVQSKTDTGHQTPGEAVKMGVVSSRTMPPHTRVPSHSRSWLSCILKSWNSLPIHLIWPLQTTMCSQT